MRLLGSTYVVEYRRARKADSFGGEQAGVQSSTAYSYAGTVSGFAGGSL